MDSPKKPAETFVSEAEVLREAQSKVENLDLSTDDLRAAFKVLTEEYEKMLDEARFLTKVSDKLESKLNSANEKLQANAKLLVKEADDSKQVAAKTLKDNRKLNQVKTDLDKQVGNTQMVLIIVIAALIIVILVFVYWTFLRNVIKP
jgi:uncharacterized membrane protein